MSLCVALAVLMGLAPSVPAATTDDSHAILANLCTQFTRYDLNNDRLMEIESLAPLPLSAAAQEARRGLVIVLIEERLLSPPQEGGDDLDLRPSLQTFARDLAREGWDVASVSASVYAGSVHQDGRTLLAMRRFLAALRAQVPDFAGVVLVGDFPEAYLVRSYNWRKHTKITINKGKPNEERFQDAEVHYLRTVPEPVAMRCELILADLDGNWERRYRQERREIPYAVAVFPDGEQPHGGRTAHYETGALAFEDFFWVNDGKYELRTFADGSAEMIPLDLENDECADADLKLPNPLARPDIGVSRINTRHIALRPKSDVVGVNGERLLSEKGLPQTVTFARRENVPRWLSVWERDPALERRLLIEYFERNHRYRSGQLAGPYYPASFAHALGSAMGELREAAPAWADFKMEGYDIRDKQATVAEAIRWLKRPALLRALNAHSDAWGSAVQRSKDVAEIEREAGGQPWSWVQQDDRLVPGLGNSTGKLDFAIFRTLWANRVLPEGANMWIHMGCDAVSPASASRVPYSDPAYGHWQGGEGLLFYCNGLVLVGRAKVFYDHPREFCQVLSAGGTWAEAWRRYFEVESARSDISSVGGGIGRKRSYFWSLLGDWTLTLRPALGSEARPQGRR